LIDAPRAPIIFRLTKGTGAQLEAELLVIIARLGLDEADDRDVERREDQRVHERYAQHPGVAHAHRAQHVEFGIGGEPAEGEQDAEQQPDRDAEAEIFGQQVGKHPPHDADRAAFGGDEHEQPLDTVEHQQHGGDGQRREQRQRDQPGHVAVEGCHAVRGSGRGKERSV
jgi:hypothetical protein